MLKVMHEILSNNFLEELTAMDTALSAWKFAFDFLVE